MGINFDQIKSKLSSLTKKNQKAKVLWKPEKGKQAVRIVPYKHNPDFPFIELFFHYDLNGQTHLSPSTFGRPDPVLEYANKLKKSGDEELWKKGRDLTPKKRTFAPVIVRGEEKEGVRFWGFGKQVYEEILSILDEGEFGDITDPVKGYDLTVEHKSAEEMGASYPKTFIRPKAKPSPIFEEPVDRELLRRITEEQPNILEVFPEPTYEQLSEALYNHLNPKKTTEDEAVVDDSVEPPESAVIKTPPAVVEQQATTPGPLTQEAPNVPTPPASPSAQASKKGQDFNDVFAALDNVLKKKA